MTPDRIGSVSTGRKRPGIAAEPQDWKLVRLGDLVAARKEKNREGKAHTVYTVSNVQGFVLSDVFFGKRVYSRDLSTYKIVRRDDFAYNPYRVNVGSLALYDGDRPGLVSPAYVVFRIRSQEVLEPRFLYFLLKSNHYRREIRRMSMSRGSVRRSLAFRDLEGFSIPLPSLPEQRRIAHVLSTVQRAVQAQDKVIAGAKELKRSLMRRLFTYGPGSEPAVTKETEIGVAPAHWQIVPLEDLVRLTQYGLSLRSEPDGSYPMLGMANLVNGRLDVSELKYVDLQTHHFAKFRLHKGDILFNRTNSHSLVGKTAMFDLDGDYVFASYLIRVVPDAKQLLPEYLSHYLNCDSAQGRLKRIAARAVSQSNISATKLRRFAIGVPPVGEQARITGAIGAVDHKVGAEQAQMRALQELFNSLLHQLVTGQLRVHNIEV